MRQQRLSQRPWRFTDKLVATLVVLVVLAALVLLIRWDSRRECVRWATRIDSTGYAAYQSSVCVEYR